MKAGAPRSTILKRIAAEPTIRRKLSVALGQSFGADFEIDSQLELFRLVEKWRIYGKTDLVSDPRIINVCERPSCLIDEMAELGYLAGTAIASGNHKFFSRLAAMVQFHRFPDPQYLYADILEFCHWSGSGTHRRPCDRWALLRHLAKRTKGGRKYGFDTSHANEFPSSLRRTCNALGIVLSSEQKANP